MAISHFVFLLYDDLNGHSLTQLSDKLFRERDVAADSGTFIYIKW